MIDSQICLIKLLISCHNVISTFFLCQLRISINSLPLLFSSFSKILVFYFPWSRSQSFCFCYLRMCVFFPLSLSLSCYAPLTETQPTTPLRQHCCQSSHCSVALDKRVRESPVPHRVRCGNRLRWSGSRQSSINTGYWHTTVYKRLSQVETSTQLWYLPYVI